MKVLHVSMECYPAAKAGGMGDVVGSLPIYLNKIGINSSVIIPKYNLPWFRDKKYTHVFSGSFVQFRDLINFTVEKVETDELGFDFYCISIPGKFDRNSIYLDTDGEGYRDEPERNIAFQRSVLDWLNDKSSNFDLIHCHDHMTGLIPFLMSHGNAYSKLRRIPTFFSIHNAAYYGRFNWNYKYLLPDYDHQYEGLLDWDDNIHSLACAVKCAWKVNTVSPSYMKEIQQMDNSLSLLFRHENEKCIGILNGIDNEVWDPKTDTLVKYNRKNTWADFKIKNKQIFADEYGLDPSLPWISFIGRFSEQKGVDTIPLAVIELYRRQKNACFIILGNGSKYLEHQIMNLDTPGRVKTFIMYNEGIAHQIYASSDFIIMPSRFEPCGLNQMFAMRYGAVPIVRATGGLIDTVVESTVNGTGFSYANATALELVEAMERAIYTYSDDLNFPKLRERCVRQNFSWEHSAEQYANEYKKLI